LLRVENDLDVDSRQSAVAAEGARLIFEWQNVEKMPEKALPSNNSWPMYVDR
jgi:hypothetical protein